MCHRHSESGGIPYGVWGSAPAGECRGRASALCRRARGRGAPECPRGMKVGRGGAKPPKAHGGKRWRAASEGSPDWEKARTMRALRERPCQWQRERLMPQGEPTPESAPRGMRHGRRKSGGVLLRGLGQCPSAGVQRAGGRPLPRGAGARSPRKPRRGRVPPESLAGAHSPRKPRRGRVAPESLAGGA